MRFLKLKLREKKSRFARSIDSLTATLRRFWRAVSGNRIVSAIRSSVRRLDIRAAHGVDIPVGEFDARRRAFLKYALFGGAVFIAGKYLTPLVNAIRGDTVLSEKTFENFKISETGRQLKVTDDDGGEILTIDKESF